MKKFLITDFTEKTVVGFIETLNALGLETFTFEPATNDDGTSTYGCKVLKNGESLGCIPLSTQTSNVANPVAQGKSVWFYGDEDGECMFGLANSSSDTYDHPFMGVFNHNGNGQKFLFNSKQGTSALLGCRGLLDETELASLYTTAYLVTDGTTSGKLRIDGPAYSNTIDDLGSYSLSTDALIAWPWVCVGGVSCDGVHAINLYDTTDGAIGSKLLIDGMQFIRLSSCLAGLLS